MARLIHLNGPPGIGKSTLARRYAEDHPGVLCCDIDVLRTLVGGWSTDFERAGSLIRPAALAMIGGYLSTGQDVVLPQMLLDPRELDRFRGCAQEVGAAYVERFLMDTREDAVARFRRRGAAEPGDPWHDQVRSIVAANGGDAALRRCHDVLTERISASPDAVVIQTAEGASDEAYAALVASLG